MALEKQIEQSTGITTTYNRLAHVKIYIDEHIDEAHRRAGDKPQRTRVLRVQNTEENAKLFAVLYKVIPEIDEVLVDATDVLEDTVESK